MDENSDRRTEHRLRYYWPIWFAENFDHALTQGQMVDVCSKGAAFTCYVDQDSPCPGQEQTIRFSVPRFESDDSFGMVSFTRTGRICRVDNSNPFLRKIAMQFAEPLPFKPGEQTDTEQEAEQKFKLVTI